LEKGKSFEWKWQLPNENYIQSWIYSKGEKIRKIPQSFSFLLSLVPFILPLFLVVFRTYLGSKLVGACTSILQKSFFSGSAIETAPLDLFPGLSKIYKCRPFIAKNKNEKKKWKRRNDINKTEKENGEEDKGQKKKNCPVLE
jgi:hypothetical protein